MPITILAKKCRAVSQDIYFGPALHKVFGYDGAGGEATCEHAKMPES